LENIFVPSFCFHTLLSLTYFTHLNIPEELTEKFAGIPVHERKFVFSSKMSGGDFVSLVKEFERGSVEGSVRWNCRGLEGKIVEDLNLLNLKIANLTSSSDSKSELDSDFKWKLFRELFIKFSGSFSSNFQTL
jgi:hypothetical protein